MPQREAPAKQIPRIEKTFQNFFTRHIGNPAKVNEDCYSREKKKQCWSQSQDSPNIEAAKIDLPARAPLPVEQACDQESAQHKKQQHSELVVRREVPTWIGHSKLKIVADQHDQYSQPA